MKNITYVMCLILTFSCEIKKKLTFDTSQIENIEVYQGYPGTKINMKIGFEKEFIKDLNESKYVGPTKYIKTHRVLVFNRNGEIDTIYTNGIIHNYKGWYKSQENLLEKYIDQNSIVSDTIKGQLKTAELLKLYMNEKKYDKAINLFSLKERKNILEIKKDSKMFEFWCNAWTFDDAKFERYITRIKKGKGHFIFENGEWKINEK